MDLEKLNGLAFPTPSEAAEAQKLREDAAIDIAWPILNGIAVQINHHGAKDGSYAFPLPDGFDPASLAGTVIREFMITKGWRFPERQRFGALTFHKATERD